MSWFNERAQQLLRPVVLFLLALAALALSRHLLDLSAGVTGADSTALIAGGEYVQVLYKLAQTLVWLSIAWLTGRLIQLMVLNPLFQAHAGKDAPAILANLISLALIVVTLLTVVGSIWERSLGALVATSGIITLVLGLALREMITDFFSGIALNLEQPYRIGDWLQMDDELVGEVVAINWRATHLCLNDKRMIIVPNGLLARSRFVNYSLPTAAYRDNMPLIFNFTIDPPRIEHILMAAVVATPGLVPGAKHRVRIDAFEARGVLVEVKFWIPTYADRIPLRHKLAVNIMSFLAQAGIPLPYSTHEVFTSRSRPQDRERRIDNDAMLRKVGLFEGLAKDELHHLAASAAGIEMPAGAEVIREGEAGESLFVVVEGLLSVSCGDHPVGQLTPGQTFGERSLLTGEPRNATVVMVTAGYLLEIDRDDLRSPLQQRPALADMLAENMVHRDRENRRLAAQVERRAVSREATRAEEIGARIRAFFHLG